MAAPLHSNPLRRAEALWRAGVERLAEDCVPEAVAIFRECTAAYPAFAPAHNDLGVLMEALGNPVQALACYRAALAADPCHRQARHNLASLSIEIDLERALHRGHLNWLPA